MSSENVERKASQQEEVSKKEARISNKQLVEMIEALRLEIEQINQVKNVDIKSNIEKEFAIVKNVVKQQYLNSYGKELEF